MIRETEKNNKNMLLRKYIFDMLLIDLKRIYFCGT